MIHNATMQDSCTNYKNQLKLCRKSIAFVKTIICQTKYGLVARRKLTFFDHVTSNLAMCFRLINIISY